MREAKVLLIPPYENEKQTLKLFVSIKKIQQCHKKCFWLQYMEQEKCANNLFFWLPKKKIPIIYTFQKTCQFTINNKATNYFKRFQNIIAFAPS